MGPSSIMGPSLNGPKLNEGTYNSKVFKYFLVVDMSWWSHRLRHVLYRSSFPLVTSCLWAATLIGTLEWPEYAKFIGPSILSGVHFWLTNGLVFVHLEIVVAVKPFWPEVIDCLLCETFRVAQHGLMVEHANHVSARLPMHHNVIAALLLIQQDFMCPAISSSNILHVVDSSAA